VHGHDRVKPRALPAAYEQLLVIQFLEVGLDYWLVVNTAATWPEPRAVEAEPPVEVPPDPEPVCAAELFVAEPPLAVVD
jgi:hypothetical protein